MFKHILIGNVFPWQPAKTEKTFKRTDLHFYIHLARSDFFYIQTAIVNTIQRKMTGGTLEVRSDKILSFLTFDIQPMDQWTKGSTDQWTNDQLYHWSIVSLVHWSIGPLVPWSIGPLVHWSIGLFDHCTIG